MRTASKEISIEKSNGRFYTPRYIVKNILDLSGYKTAIRKKHVIDNSCGDGAFLTEIVRRYCRECSAEGISAEQTAAELSEYIHGVEIDGVECKKCINNVRRVADEFGVSNVRWDIICDDSTTLDRYDGKMDFVFGNPPYIRVHNLGDSYDNIKNFSFAQNGMTDLFIVFYEIGIKMLNETGVLGYITPSSYFNSLAGKYMRKELISNNYIESVVDLQHFQAFEATTYTAITVLRKNKSCSSIGYYQYDVDSRRPKFIDTLDPDDFYIGNNFYFSSRSNLKLLKRVIFNLGKSDIYVKNGYATLCDGVFVDDFDFESEHIIPAIKASKGVKKKILYPYDEEGNLIPETELKKDTVLYEYLLAHKEELQKRSIEKNHGNSWYAFGRSQAINDTYTDKIAVNNLIRDLKDLKVLTAPKGTGIYSGLYLTSATVPFKTIKELLLNNEFLEYVSLLGKYKSGGYYTFSSKDLKAYLDFKLAYDGGIFCYE